MVSAFKKILTVLICVMALSCQQSFVYVEDIDANSLSGIGDVNGDGVVNAVDYVVLSKYLDNQRDIDEQYLDSCDVNDDGNIDVYDKKKLRSMVYYGQVDNIVSSVDSKTIHTTNQRNFLEAGYNSISQYKGGGDAALPITLQYGSSIVPSGSLYTIKVSEKPDMSDAKTYTSRSRSVSIQNSKVQQIYFWTVSNGSVTSNIQAFYVDDIPVRNLSTATIGNARDIGGFETEDGFIVKQGMIYRGYMMSPGPDLETNRDVLINDLKIQTEIDIKEKQSDSSIYYDPEVLNTRPEEDFEHYLRRYLKYEYYGGYMSPSYKSMPTLVKIFDDLADESVFPIYIHCRIGADRTGLVCFLFNALLGVSKEDCYKDYVFTTYSGNARSAGLIAGDYVATIERTAGRTFAEKTYNLLVMRGANPESLDRFISIMKTSKPKTKTYVELPAAISTELHYDGSEKVMMLQDDYLFNIRGNKATSVGDYVATVSLKDPYTYSWADGSKSDKTISWSIEDVRSTVSAPDVSFGEYVYNGEEITIDVPEEEYYTVSGNKGTNAGEYELTISLTDKSLYVWEDETNDDLVYKWTIEKADVDLSEFVIEDMTFDYDGSEKEYVYTGELPEGITAVTYADNMLIGNPFTETSIETTLSFEVDDNHNPIEDMKAVLTIMPVYSDLDIEFDYENIEPIIVDYNGSYNLPSLQEDGYTFLGWYMEVDGEYIRVEQSGIWDYDIDVREVLLVPRFAPDGNYEEADGSND